MPIYCYEGKCLGVKGCPSRIEQRKRLQDHSLTITCSDCGAVFCQVIEAVSHVNTKGKDLKKRLDYHEQQFAQAGKELISGKKSSDRAPLTPKESHSAPGCCAVHLKEKL